jgi:hypothetical protein
MHWVDGHYTFKVETVVIVPVINDVDGNFTLHCKRVLTRSHSELYHRLYEITDALMAELQACTTRKKRRSL